MSRVSHTEEIAARWLLRQEEASWSDADQSELDAWLNNDVENKVTYWRMEHGWRKVDRMAALRRPALSTHRREPQRPRRWYVVAAASIAACALISIIIVLNTDFSSGTRYATEIGGRETVPLADGSKIELNTATAVRTIVNDKARQVWLDKGEVYFEVAHDPSRPFVVHAGSRTITVLGTKFSVWREDDRLRVAVAEGRVQVEDRHAGRSAPLIMTDGAVATAQGASPPVAQWAADRVNAELSWRQGVLTFDHISLAEAAGDFNRYNRKKLVITSTTVARMQIGGRFEPTNVEAFVRLLQEAYGLKVDDDGRTVRISD